MRKAGLATALLTGGVLLSACAGGPSASYVRGYNSNLDGASSCSFAPPDVAASTGFENGCNAASQQWLNTFENSTGPFSSGTALTILPGNPKYKIAPIN
jgi:hypothetical protein